MTCNLQLSLQFLLQIKFSAPVGRSLARNVFINAIFQLYLAEIVCSLTPVVFYLTESSINLNCLFNSKILSLS